MLKGNLEKQSKALEDFKAANGIKQNPRPQQSSSRDDGGDVKSSGVLV